MNPESPLPVQMRWRSDVFIVSMSDATGLSTSLIGVVATMADARKLIAEKIDGASSRHRSNIQVGNWQELGRNLSVEVRLGDGAVEIYSAAKAPFFS